MLGFAKVIGNKNGWNAAAITGQRNERLVAVVCYTFINLAGFVLIGLGLNGVAYVWMAPAWLIFHVGVAKQWTRRVIWTQPIGT